MRYIVVALLSLVVGFFTGYAFSERSAFDRYREWRDSDAYFRTESTVAFALMNIRSAERGDNQDVVRKNCFIAKTSVDLIDPNFYEDPGKQKEVAALVSRAKNVISSLESSGKCFGPWREG
jgi:hypothetical protein